MYKDLFTSKLARKVPKVMEVLRKYMISTDAFLIDWMYTIYSKCFSIKVTRVLSQKGVHLARRTVSKYRDGMQIPPVEARRMSATA